MISESTPAFLLDQFEKLAEKHSDLFHCFIVPTKTTKQGPLSRLPDAAIDLALSCCPIKGCKIIEPVGKKCSPPYSVYMASTAANVEAARQSLTDFKAVAALAGGQMKLKRPTKWERTYIAPSAAAEMRPRDPSMKINRNDPSTYEMFTHSGRHSLLADPDEAWLDHLYQVSQHSATFRSDAGTPGYAAYALPCNVFLASVLALGTEKPQPAGRQVALRNDPRNKWLYGQFCKMEHGALVPQTTIVRRLKEVCNKKKWTFCADISTLKRDVNKWAKRNGKPPVPDRQQGRKPRNSATA